MNIYGDECSIVKLDCIGHVMERTGARLRKLKVSMQNGELSDGTKLSGRGGLTDKAIDQI